MGENEILHQISIDLRLDNWWKELLGQTPDYTNFDITLAEKSLPRTELKAAKAIHDKFKNILSYTEARNQWFLWNGTIHEPCDGDGVALKITKFYYDAMVGALEFIKEYYDVLARQAENSGSATATDDAKKIRALYDKGEVAKHKLFRDRLASDSGMNALIRVMKTECDVPSDYYDNDQRWFVMKNWVLDLDSVRANGWDMVRHDPSMPVTKFFDANYTNPGEPVKNLGHWDRFLEYSIPSKESRDYLQIVIGAAFMGESKLRTIINLHGPPGSGKSVLLNTFFKLGKGGAGYVCMPDSKSIIKVTGQNFEQDSFRGRRFFGVSEPPMHDAVDNEFLKKLTGDEWVETRTLNVKSSGWVPQGVPFIATNKPLKINTRDKAIVERVQMIEFPIEFEYDHPDPARRRIAGLEELIMDDSDRVLMWVIEGMIKYVRAGKKLNPPAEVLRLQSEVVTEASTALRWVEDFIEEELLEINYETKPEFFLPIKDAYMRYNMWITMTGERRAMPMRFFSQDIEGKYGERVKAKGLARFPGLTVTAEYRRVHGGQGVAAIDNDGF